MPFLILQDTSLQTVPRGADAVVRKAGEVLDDDQVDAVTQGLLRDGDPHVRAILAPVTEDEGHRLRVGRIALEMFANRAEHGDAERGQVATTPASALRWADTNPNNAEHVSELEGRLASLERRVVNLERDASGLGAGAEAA
jgi:hypothetical protein